MQPITITLPITLQARAYQAYQQAIDAHPELKRREVSVQEWLSEELNNHPEVIIEMLLDQY
jgi:hypothetical protein